MKYLKYTFLILLIYVILKGSKPLVCYASTNSIIDGSYWVNITSYTERFVPTNEIINDYNNPFGWFIIHNLTSDSYYNCFVSDKYGLLNNNRLYRYRDNVLFSSGYSVGGATIPADSYVDYNDKKVYFTTTGLGFSDSFGDGYLVVSVDDMSVDNIKKAVNDYLNYNDYKSDLGVIKASYFFNMIGMEYNANSTNEIVRWQKTSTTGVDITESGYKVELAIKDKSYYINSKLNSHSSLLDYIQKSKAWLQSYIYPYGSDEREYLRGGIKRSVDYDSMISVAKYDGSLLEGSIPAWSVYSGHSNDGIIKNWVDYLQGSENDYKSYNDIAYSNFLKMNNAVMLSWDIYARIIAPDGSKGHWLKINKHSNDIGNQGDSLNGGVTKLNVNIPDYSPTDSGFTKPISDEVILPFDDDDDAALPVGYVDDNGDTIINYYNYTYNYDNL